MFLLGECTDDRLEHANARDPLFCFVLVSAHVVGLQEVGEDIGSDCMVPAAHGFQYDSDKGEGEGSCVVIFVAPCTGSGLQPIWPHLFHFESEPPYDRGDVLHNKVAWSRLRLF